jgi:magnesium chelatase family protein
MLKKVYTTAVIGLSADIVEVETDISSGLPATIVVGLPDAAIRESRERVKSALKHSSAEFPKSRVAVNLAPADLPKIGTHYDLPIAVSILLSSGQTDFDSKKSLFVGELALDGKLRPVPGVLLAAECAAEHGFETIFVPKENAPEAFLVKGIKTVSVKTLSDLLGMLSGLIPIRYFEERQMAAREKAEEQDSPWDFRLIRGQEMAKRALEIAAGGGHNILMTGPPGSGKTLLARGFSSVLPQLSYEEALEVTKIISVSGLASGMGLVRKRPFRSPHHTSSSVALVGGGSEPRPGEITLAHRGVLFLDEFSEFPRHVLESMRQPLEDGVINVARASRSVSFPAKFMLVAAQNPCPCGFSGDPEKVCVCTPTQLIKYQKKISGPLLDRIDLHVEVPRLSFEKIEEQSDAESSSAVRVRVERCRNVQRKRFARHGLKFQTNAEMGIKEIREFCRPDAPGLTVLRTAVSQHHLSARSYHRILKLARTVADLTGDEQLTADHIAEALMFRPKADS